MHMEGVQLHVYLLENISWEIRARLESKKRGICLFDFLKRMHVGDLKLLQDADGHEYGQS